MLLGLVLVARRTRDRPGPATAPNIPAWLVPVGAGLLSAGLTVWVWGGLRASAVLHDEAAYLLQAGILARGTWSLPSPVVPYAFTQAAVLVTPVLTPKMAPGHALLLVPGVVAALPGLVPVLLTAITAATLVALVRRVASSGIAVMTLAVWLTQGGQLRWRASYMSETTTGALWLLGWWCLLRWRETRRLRWLIALAAAAGLGAVTRPLTMLAWAIPVGVLVARDVLRLKRWRDLGAAFAVGAACLAILPVQNVATLGSWRKTPLALYTRQYSPSDVLGFGLDTTPPLIQPPADLQRAWAGFVERHREHTVRALPGVLLARLNALRLQTTGQWRVLWIPAAVVGVFLVGSPGGFALLTGVLLYLCYLLYAHEPSWVIYYLEATPVAAFVCALGLAWVLARLSGRRSWPLPLAVAAALAILAAGGRDIANARAFRASAQEPLRQFARLVANAGPGRKIIFVRYDPAADPNTSFVRNADDPDHAAVLTAYDLGGAEDSVVAAAYPDREAFLWDQRTRRLTPLPLDRPTRGAP